MGRVRTSAMVRASWALVALLGISGCSDGGGGGHRPAPCLASGLYKGCELQFEDVGGVWEATSVMFGCSLDGIGSVGIDLDLDGVYADETASYECRPDGTISAIDSEGVYSEDGEMAAVTAADLAAPMGIRVLVRESSGMSVADFSGLYLVTRLAFNRATGVAHTYAMAAGQTGAGLGLFSVLLSSDPAVAGTAPFAFDVEDDGTFTILDSNERGGLRSDGSMFAAAEADGTNDIDAITFGIRPRDGVSSRILHGEYILNLVGQNTTTREPWAARILATFDGVAVARYEFLAHPTDGGLTGYMAYSVHPSGLLFLALLPSGPLEFGVVSPDGGTFSVIDANPSDGDIYVLIGIRRPT